MKAIALLLWILYFCISEAKYQRRDACHLYFKKVVVEIGTNIGPHVERRILSYLQSVDGVVIEHIKSSKDSIDKKSSHWVPHFSDEGQLFLSLGNSSSRKEVISQSFLDSLHPESFYMHFSPLTTIDNSFVLASDGLPLDLTTHQNVSFDKLRVHYGAVVGAYAALEELGFAFLHPLEPTIPSQLRIRNPSCYKTTHSFDDVSYTEDPMSLQTLWSFNRTESPHWPERGFHIHTQHPLELTEVLQGHDIPQFGPHGPSCKQFSKRKPMKGAVAAATAAVEGEAQYHGDIPTTSSNSPSSSAANAGSVGGGGGSDGSNSAKGPYCERWEDMVTDVDYLFEWAIANRLNKIEWLLLGSYKWGDEWETRRGRLRTLTSLGHQYSLMVGADVPLGNIQQHGWYIVNVRLPFTQQVQQIQERVDWVLGVGFDFLTTESGLSEFTHPECDHMLELINAFAEHVNSTWGREAAIKVHCSTGQTCDGFQDPRTGEPINFNFLPTYAHPGMGVFPHTVQVYALDDPTAFAYGNENFSYVEDYMVYEAKLHNRSVTFYGETAYWVNVDIDVPLFLPLYGQRRQHDLRRIALREIREGFRIDGQMNFDSGWEWGYWLSDVVTARASWQPQLAVAHADTTGGTGVRESNPSHHHHHHHHHQQQQQDNRVIEKVEQASGRSDSVGICEADEVGRQCPQQTDLYASIPPDPAAAFDPSYSAAQDQWEAFSRAILPYTLLYGPEYGARLNALIVEIAQVEAEVLINGRVNGTASPGLKKLSGMAYLSGGDTWVDIPRMFGMAFTQPDKIHIKESHDPDWPHVLRLLSEMATVFQGLSEKTDALYAEIMESTLIVDSSSEKADTFHINAAALGLLWEIKDCVTMLALRAQQVQLLYRSRDPYIGAEEVVRKDLQLQGRGLVHKAEEVVARREALYRVPWQRVGEWRENPTVYRFGYLWAVHSLFYWWRDQGLAEQGSIQSEHSPCYLNRMDPIEVAVGWGKYTLEVLRAFINRYTPFSAGSPLEVVNCLSPPEKGYEFPKDLYHF